MRTTGTNRAVPGKRIDSHLITCLVLSAGTARKKEEAASRFLSLILLVTVRSNEPGEPNGVTITTSLVLPVGVVLRAANQNLLIAGGNHTTINPTYMSKGSMPRTGWPASDR